MFFATLILWAATLVLSEILKPKPKSTVKPSSLGDFSFPTTTEERAVPLLWGTVKLEGPNVVWYGDLEQRAMKQKQKTGLFSSTNVTIGYKYFLGVQFGLCTGPVDSLRRIWIGDDEVWSGVHTSGTLTIDQPKLFGGNKLGTGGVVGDLTFFNGAASQSVSTYIAQFQHEGGDTPAYNGFCYAVFEHGWLGNSTSIEPWAFELRRHPLGPDGVSRAVNSNADANPAYVLYEIITNSDWGLGFAIGDVDTAAFISVATTLATEGNGFSLIRDTASDISDLIDEIQKQIDGIVYLDMTTGKWTIKLARNDYNPATLPVISAANYVEVKDFTRVSWSDTSNYVTTPYKDRAKDYKGTYGLAQDMANIRIQGQIVKSETDFPGVKDATLANSLAWRELRALSFPLAKVTVVVNREFYGLTPAQVVKFSSTPLGIEELIMRVTRVDYGELTNGKIELTLVQDIYATAPPSFADAPLTGWTAPSNVPVAIPAADTVYMEAPRAISIRDPESLTNGLPSRVWVAAENQGDGAVEFDVRTRTTGDYTTESTIDTFLMVGTLSATLGAAVTSGSITVVPSSHTAADMAAEFGTVDATSLGRDLTHLLLIDNEFILVTSAAVSTGNLVLSTVYRGVLDSAIATHGSGAKVYMLFVGGGIGNRSWEDGNTVYVKLVSRSRDNELAEASATVLSIGMSNRHLRPYAPIGVTVNGSASYASGPHSLDDNGSLDSAGLLMGYTRRDYVEEQENARHLGGDAAPSNTTTVYRARVWDASSSPVELFASDYNAGGTTVLVDRTRVLRYTSGVVPTALRIDIEAKHTIDATDYTARQAASHTCSVESAELSAMFNGGVIPGATYSSSWVVPDTGSYSVTLGTVMGIGNVRISINGGVLSTIISSGSTSGSVALTAGDSVRLYATAVSVTGRNETILFLEPPVTAGGMYVILRS